MVTPRRLEDVLEEMVDVLKTSRMPGRYNTLIDIRQMADELEIMAPEARAAFWTKAQEKLSSCLRQSDETSKTLRKIWTQQKAGPIRSSLKPKIDEALANETHY